MTRTDGTVMSPHGLPRPELVLVATPIGNLGDFSERAAQTLRQVDAIACEDTRHTRKLLAAKEILGKRLLAVHEHNEHAAAFGIIGLLQAGKTVALVTDAGTPGISDPGARVVRAVIDAGFDVTHVPGPVALIAALVCSGLPTERFVFEGFLPRKGRDRSERISALQAEVRTVVVYEAPGRVAPTLVELGSVLGPDRRVAVCRELTKRFETIWRGTLGEVSTDPSPIGAEVGEYVLVLDGAHTANGGPTDEALAIMVTRHLEDGATVRDAVDAVVDETGAGHRRIYRLALEIQRFRT